jgi:hypothetical protein
MPFVLGDRAIALLEDLFSDPELVLLCPLNDKSSEAIRSWVTGQRLAGVMNGTPTYGVTLGSFKGITFVAASQHRVSFGDVDALDFGAASTWSTLVITNQTTVASTQAYIGKYNGTSGWVHYMNSSGQPAAIVASNVGAAALLHRRSNTALVAGTPRLIGCTYDGSSNANGLRFFGSVGEEAGTVLANNPIGTVENAHDVRIGATADNANHLNATLALVAVFNAQKLERDYRRWGYLAGLN